MSGNAKYSGRRREVVPLDKRILEQYIDACAQVKETEAELEKIRRAKKRQSRMPSKAHHMIFHIRCRRIGLRDLRMHQCKSQVQRIVWKKC